MSRSGSCSGGNVPCGLEGCPGATGEEVLLGYIGPPQGFLTTGAFVFEYFIREASFLSDFFFASIGAHMRALDNTLVSWIYIIGSGGYGIYAECDRTPET